MPPPGVPSALPLAVHTFRRPLPYTQTLALQDAIFQLRSAARKVDPTSEVARRDVLLLLEHRPTYTTGRRDSSAASLERVRQEAQRLERAGADWAVTRRGGQVTYHGPGQVVGYFVSDLGPMKLNTKCYVDKVQKLLKIYVQKIIEKDVFAPHPEDHVGVFPTVDSKISSIGIHIRQRLTTHGFSLNVTDQPLPWFEEITACGLPSIRATSLSTFLPPPTLSTSELYRIATLGLADKFGESFGKDGAWEVLSLESEVGRLVSELERSSGADGKIWRETPAE